MKPPTIQVQALYRCPFCGRMIAPSNIGEAALKRRPPPSQSASAWSTCAILTGSANQPTQPQPITVG